MAKVLYVVHNSIGEVIQAVLLKSNKSVVKRDTSSVIPLVKNGQPGETCELEDEHHVDTVVPVDKSEERSKHQAALTSHVRGAGFDSQPR